MLLFEDRRVTPSLPPDPTRGASAAGSTAAPHDDLDGLIKGMHSHAATANAVSC